MGKQLSHESEPRVKAKVVLAHGDLHPVPKIKGARRVRRRSKQAELGLACWTFFDLSVSIAWTLPGASTSSLYNMNQKDKGKGKASAAATAKSAVVEKDLGAKGFTLAQVALVEARVDLLVHCKFHSFKSGVIKIC